jgi:hypothetical protein
VLAFLLWTILLPVGFRQNLCALDSGSDGASTAQNPPSQSLAVPIAAAQAQASAAKEFVHPGCVSQVG